jgi:hypothetical protein
MSHCSALYVFSETTSNIDLSTFSLNTGDNVIQLRTTGRVAEVTLCNFIDNVNKQHFVIVSSGMWTVRQSVFLRNKGTGFRSVEDQLVIRKCFLDVNPETLSHAELDRDVEIGTQTATIPITDFLSGFCPGSGTPLTAMPSPSPGSTTISGTASISSVVTDVRAVIASGRPTRSRVPLVRGGSFGYAAFAFLGVFAMLIWMASCAKSAVGSQVRASTRLVETGEFLDEDFDQ